MVKSKKSSGEELLNIKKVKTKFMKKKSGSGVESKKSPKHRIKSITAPTSLKKKVEKSLNDWTVSDTSNKKTGVNIKQLEITYSTDEDLEVKPSVLKTKKENKSKIKNKVKTGNAPQNVSKTKKEIKVQQETKEDPNDTEVDEAEHFGIKASDVAKVVKTVIKLHTENPKLKNQLFDDPVPLFLQVCSHKVPRGPSRILRIPLPNSMLTPDSEVCLIVPEVKGVKNIEHEKHVEHYEDLLRRKGVENIKKIMTFHELRTEYETFEQKSRLVNLYDMFLVDGRISGKVVNKCGKIFYNKKKVPTAVKLQATKLKEHIDKALSKTFFLLHLKGDSYSVQFGHNRMETQELVDNLFAVLEGLNKEFPGGFDNIKGVHVYSLRSSSIPIYTSFKSPADVKMPVIKPKKPKAYKTYTDELSTLPDADVQVQPSGRVIVKRKKEEEEGNSGEGQVKSKKAKKRKNKGENAKKGNGEGRKKKKGVQQISNGNIMKNKIPKSEKLNIENVTKGNEKISSKKSTKKANIVVKTEDVKDSVKQKQKIIKKLKRKINNES